MTSLLQTLELIGKFLSDNADLQSQLTVSTIIRFLVLVKRLWAEICGIGPTSTIPLELPSTTVLFLRSVLQLSQHDIQLCWLGFKDLIPGLDGFNQTDQDDAFRLHGPTAGVGAEFLQPPITSCSDPKCNRYGKALGERRVVESVLYTLRRGVLPVFSHSLYCRGCFTRYYLNYSVTNADDPQAQRVYYKTGTIPRFLHVTEKSFVEAELAVFFETQMAFQQYGKTLSGRFFISQLSSSASADSIARTYNACLGTNAANLPNPSSLQGLLPYETVYDAFFLHALLRDGIRNDLQLWVPHGGLQYNRWDQVLLQRNLRMAGTGQEVWGHACKKCMRVEKDENGNLGKKFQNVSSCSLIFKSVYLSAAVIDGVKLGHTRCSFRPVCFNMLARSKDRFCELHRHLLLQCFIKDCTADAEKGHISCTDPSHRAEETKQQTSDNEAIFQLSARLTRLGTSADLRDDEERPEADTEETLVPETSPKGPNAEAGPKGRMARLWTHNEELVVLCCGLILARATFYNSEGLAAVRDFLKVVYPPDHRGYLPTFLFYDNNCGLLEMLQSSGDDYFKGTAFLIDVFHASTHHKEGHDFCNRNCNPAGFPELFEFKDGKWRWKFNSTAAEQANK
ncbi:hypothetical protein C8J56DRAFT_1060151 [Mycena floridula]|nr:hypothetical protein C8J56DRAFT_1060151 [Mycena floridula]